MLKPKEETNILSLTKIHLFILILILVPTLFILLYLSRRVASLSLSLSTRSFSPGAHFDYLPLLAALVAQIYLPRGSLKYLFSSPFFYVMPQLHTRSSHLDCDAFREAFDF
jgi:hypothetical protein